MHADQAPRHTIFRPEDMPRVEAPLFAVAGRSNVGKSSLINCLAGRKGLARTSGRPGKTRSLNYYWLPAEKYYLVDLPGYGYAKRSKQERRQWAELVDRFLTGSETLRGVVVLIDARIPVQETDLELVRSLQEGAVPVLAVLTKADKCGMSDRQRSLNRWQSILPSQAGPILFSAKTGLGRKRVLSRLAALAG